MDSSLSGFLGVFADGKGAGFKTAGIIIAVAMILTVTVEAIFFLSLAVMGISVGIEFVASLICLAVGWHIDGTKKKKHKHTRRRK
jgi:hypothetical protein